MKNKKIVTLLIIINLFLIGICINSNTNIVLNDGKKIIKEMTEGEYESQITQLNKSHEDYQNKIQECKTAIATALTNEGVETSDKILLEEMAEKIPQILQARTSDATASAEDILEGKTAYVNGKVITGKLSSDNGEITERVVWENTNAANATFSATTVTLSEDVTNKRVILYGRSNNSGDTTMVIDTAAYYIWGSSENAIGGREGSYSCSTRQWTISGNQVTFGSGQAAGGNSTRYMIPIKIVVLE